jgi:uracil-DNA glycosylase
VDLTEKENRLQEIAKEIDVCERCDLYRTRKKSVPGEGPAFAEVMLIGEAPGYYENEQGRPFVGASGKFLNDLLKRANLDRSEVFITNVIKSRPPENRDPLTNELVACAFWLEQQIDVINPKMIVTLGRFSMAHFLPGAKISDTHGQATWVKDRLIVAMYHPAAALHQQRLKSTLEEDFEKLPKFLAQARQPHKQSSNNDTGPSDQGDPTQLSLFS